MTLDAWLNPPTWKGGKTLFPAGSEGVNKMILKVIPDHRHHHHHHMEQTDMYAHLSRNNRATQLLFVCLPKTH